MSENLYLRDSSSLALLRFNGNTGDIESLLEIHEDMGGMAKGRRTGLEVLNKSAIVLITACWEAYVEDVAKEALEYLIVHCSTPSQIPSLIKAGSATYFLNQDKKSKDEKAIWDLAGDGWKEVLENYAENYIEGFHNPRPDKVKALFSRLVGIRDITQSWKWQKMKTDSATSKLNELITLRGGIAHRLYDDSGQTIKKAQVVDYLNFVNNLVSNTDKFIRQHVNAIVE